MLKALLFPHVSGPWTKEGKYIADLVGLEDMEEAGGCG